MGKAAVAPRIEKTTPVRVSGRCYNAVSDVARQHQRTPPAHFGPLLEPWVQLQFEKALREAKKGRVSDISHEQSQRGDAVLRMPRGQVKRLGVVSSITGRTISEMIEEKLWELLGTR